jgi:hypothetical protein
MKIGVRYALFPQGARTQSTVTNAPHMQRGYAPRCLRG